LKSLYPESFIIGTPLQITLKEGIGGEKQAQKQGEDRVTVGITQAILQFATPKL
jgi:hypothetical protein